MNADSSRFARRSRQQPGRTLASLVAGLALICAWSAAAEGQVSIGLRPAAGVAASKPVAKPQKAAAKSIIYARPPRLDNGPGRAEVSFAVSAPVKATSFVLAAPDRIVVDLPRVEFAAGRARRRRAAVQIPGALVSAYRFGLFAPRKSRIVISLAAPARVLRAASISDASGSRVEIVLAKTDRASFLAAARRDVAAVAADVPPPPPPPPASNLPIVVIDPGHGGIDSGAVNHGLVEKNIVFAFAKVLVAKLRASGHYKVIMTRNSDVFVSLGDRVKIAEDSGASLFVSIHADTIPDASKVSGATFYTCSEHASDAEAERTAEKENAADAVAGVESKDQNPHVSDILSDLTRQETRTYSRVFARTLVNYWRVAARLNKNPERYAGFRVLKAPDVPSVLIELGYLSNVTDGAELISPKWRDKMTDRVASAIDAFFVAKGVLPEKSAAATVPAVDPMPTAALK